MNPRQSSAVETFKLSTLTIFLVFFVFGLLLYSLTLSSPFKTLDDYYAIIINPKIKDAKYIGEILTSSFFGDNSYYRPLVYLSFMAEYHLFKLKVFFYNFDNILLHILNAFAVFLILDKILKNRQISFSSAFLFLVHPIHVEGVSNIAGRSIVLCALFVLWGFYFFLEYLENKKGGAWFLILSLVCYVLGLLSKEPAVILFLIVIAYLYLFKSQIALNKSSQKLAAISFFVLTALYFIMRKTFGVTSVFHWISPEETVLGIITFLKAALTYIHVLIVPVDLYYDRSMVLFKSFMDPMLWFILLIWTAILFVFIKKYKEISRTDLFFILWFALSLLPVSQIIPIKISSDHISTADHFLYLPSIGFFAWIATRGQYLFNEWSKKGTVQIRTFRICLIGYMFFLMLTTLQLNIYSRNQMALFERSLKHNPDNSRVRNALGVAYGLVGEYKKSQESFEYVLKKEPWDVRARIGLGKVLGDQGKYWESILEYEKIEHAGMLEDIRKNNLKYSYQILLEEYQEGLKEDPANALLNYSYGIILSKHGQAEKAIEFYKRAIELDPALKNAYFNLASTYDVLGRTNEAVSYYEKSLTFKEDQIMDSYALERLSKLYGNLGEQEKAGFYLKKLQALGKK